jgi:hypothetical protein
MDILAASPSRPQGKANLFSASGYRKTDAIIGIGNEGVKWGLYCDGYKQAADVLADHFLGQHECSAYYQSQAYAIMFLYRHYLELRLKELFIAYGHLLDLDDTIKVFDYKHKLIPLWQEVRRRDKTVSTESSCEIDADMELLEDIIEQFACIDLNSEIFRYPVLKDGKTVTLPPIQVPLQQLKEVMRWASYVMDGWSVGVDQYIAAKHGEA